MNSNFFKNIFRRRGNDDTGILWIYTQCDRCGEKFKTIIRKYNDLTPTYKNEGPAFILKKELIGVNCPQRINLKLEFDKNYRQISEEIEGGHFLTPDEYQS
ncbi:MAG: hypothetical protein Kow00103_00840 [Candidatus Caldatribacteriota bacterium]